MQKQNFIINRGLIFVFAFLFLSAIFCPVNVSADDGMPSISITSPTQGDVFKPGEKILIKWNQTNVNMYLIGLKSCPSCLNWITSEPKASDINNTSGEYEWTVPSEAVQGDRTLQIEIVAYNSGIGSVSADSGSFIVRNSASQTEAGTMTPQINKGVVVDSPIDSDVWKVGNTYNIKWHTTGSVSYSHVEIWLDGGQYDSASLKGMEAVYPVTPYIWGGTVFNTGPNVSNVGSYSWAIPSQYILTSSDFNAGTGLRLYPFLNPNDLSINIHAVELSRDENGVLNFGSPAPVYGKFRLFIRLYGDPTKDYGATGFSVPFLISPPDDSNASAVETVQNKVAAPAVASDPVASRSSENIDINLSKRLSGKILLQVESAGAAWYIDPSNYKRYSLGRPDEAFQIMRERGIGITNSDLNKIPVVVESLASYNPSQDSDHDGYPDKTELQNGYSPNGPEKLKIDAVFAARQKGKIFLQVQSKGEAWYVNPDNNKRYYLGRPQDAFNVMRNLGLGISNVNIGKIGIAN